MQSLLNRTFIGFGRHHFAGNKITTMVWILVLLHVVIGIICNSTCDVTTQEILADSSWRSLTSTGYNKGSGSYIHNMDCWWRIDSGADDLKLLLFLTRDLACPGDKISIYDGDSTIATPLASDMCGTSATPTHYSTTQRHAYIRLVTDASVSRAGIKLEFLAAKDYSGTGCTASQTLIAVENSNLLSSPNFPGLYANAKTCRWLITSLAGTVDLDFVFSDIEDDLPSRCDYDKYIISDGNDRCDNNMVRTVCSQYPKVTPFTFTSSGSSVLLSFVSDSSFNRRGFLLRYKSNATSTTTAATQTTESSIPYTTSSSVEKNSQVSNTCMDSRIVIGIVFGSLVVVIFSVIVVILMILRFHNLQKTVKPDD